MFKCSRRFKKLGKVRFRCEEGYFVEKFLKRLCLTYPVFGEKDESNVSFRPLASWDYKKWTRWGWEKNYIHGTMLFLCPDLQTDHQRSWGWKYAKMASHLVLQCDLSAQGIVSIPLLSEGQTMLCPFVLGLQGACHFAGLCVSRACAREFLETVESRQ